jgi:hypothetical protein
MTEFFDRTVESLRKGPLGPLVRLVEAHPRLSAWAVLAIGMVILLVIEGRDVGLLPGQWATLIVATVLVAGLSIWIISWEEDEDLTEEGDEADEA